MRRFCKHASILLIRLAQTAIIICIFKDNWNLMPFFSNVISLLPLWDFWYISPYLSFSTAVLTMSIIILISAFVRQTLIQLSWDSRYSLFFYQPIKDSPIIINLNINMISHAVLFVFLIFYITDFYWNWEITHFLLLFSKMLFSLSARTFSLILPVCLPTQKFFIRLLLLYFKICLLNC